MEDDVVEEEVGVVEGNKIDGLGIPFLDQGFRSCRIRWVFP